MEGQIALVERGDCSFVSKVISKPSETTFFNLDNTLHWMQVIKAQEAGAVGVIVADRVIFTLLLELVPTNNLGHISFIMNKNLHRFSQSCRGN